MASLSSIHRRVVLALLAVFAALLAAIPALAQDTNIEARLIAEGPAQAGETVTVAIEMKPSPGWHGYWLNPGDAGLGMQLEWSLPDGAQAGEPQYPVPSTLVVSGLMNHVYKGDYAVLVPLTLPPDAKDGARLPIAVDAQWLACTDEVCVPEQARLETTVVVDPSGRPEPRFDAWRTKLPAPLDAAGAFAVEGDTIRIAVPLPAGMALSSPHLFLAEDKVAAYAAAQSFARTEDRLVVTLQRPKFAPIDPETVSGVLRLNEAGDGLSFSASPGAVPTGGEPVETGGTAPAASLPLLLLGALVGGLLLNVMPCVFPILSLKALSLARSGESPAQARSEGIAYTAGVIVATLALGALLLALRAAGQEIGWAFQLQEPGVVAALLLLAVAITANFLGLFDFTVPGIATAGSPQGAFATGVLASFVATPCTGPFMAAAMGAALLLPVVPALALFATLGLGIALPFLAVAFVPALRSRLPKPGPWMETFRRWMALPMGLTALALAWLTWRIGGTTFAMATACVTGGLLLALYLIGRQQRSEVSDGRHIPAIVRLGVVAALAAALFATIEPEVRSEMTDGVLDTTPYSAQALDEARQTGKPVFAWFTADWCITCKVNEQVAIEREETKAAFEKAGVIVLRGDWTRRDPAITRYLTAQGAAGVPLYVWYSAGGGEPETLPQVLTPDMLVEKATE